MKDSEEKETRISNLKNMLDNMSNDEEENLDSFTNEELYEYDDSDDYEIVDAEEMINTLSEDNEEPEEELIIDDEFIYKPSEKLNSEPLLFENNEIDENFIIETKLEHTDFPNEDSNEYIYDNDSEFNPFSIDNQNQEEYINEKFDNIFKKKIGKYSIVAIMGLIFGILLILFAILSSLSSQQRIIDNVSSGEVNTIVAVCLLIGILFIILSLYKLTKIKIPFDNVISSMKNLDEDKNEHSSKQKEEVVIEQKPLANDHKKVKKVGEFDISNIKQKIENTTSKLEGVTPKTESRNTNKNLTPKNIELTQEEEEYQKAKLDSESIDDIFADMKEIEDVPIISIDSKDKK